MRHDVHNFIQHQDLFKDGGTVVVAVSGGPDSMALLHFLHTERERYNLQVIAAHAHHQLRAKEADEDWAYILRFCELYRIPVVTKKLDVREYQQQTGDSIQVAARECRYEWLKDVMVEKRAQFVATAHHGDDQIETILMKQVRGSYTLSKGGIPVQRPFGTGTLIRPFLRITKAQIEQYCKDTGILPRRDSSNQSPAYTRNRFRQQLLPFIKAENPQAHVHFQRLSEWKQDDETFLLQLAEQSLSEATLEKNEQKMTIDRVLFLQASLPLQRRMIHLILNYLYGKFSPFHTSIHIERILELINGKAPSKEVHLPEGLVVKRVYERFECSFYRNTIPFLTQTLSVPGELLTSVGRFKAELLTQKKASDTKAQFSFSVSDLELPLIIRSRLPGDRVSLQTKQGSKKVNRLFIDEKVEKGLRNCWPIVTDGKGKILWIPGLYRLQEQSRSEGPTSFLAITFEPSIEQMQRRMKT
ncbi:tRNA lysidine(34) synthetase TilS [Halalkalibacterium ligniniphilum]|uniref:tRNA lysidine(34) synthetase TilS n=1 Tax=Halalkalibacterium ligniniphilum TaxID=1134413 RepID=UPI00034A9B75|nr:tRNA lysidine(34) synthetase TilS [Halalkalibacterium ligniniphilum]